jgi:AcrR family transcriptional regulator
MKKSSATKIDILNTALPLVRRLGFESLSISALAKEVGMSKSGLFAHFNSKEKMHIMILDHAAMEFTTEVIVPSLSTKRGLPRLRKIIENWLKWYGSSTEGTCPFVAAGVEYDLRPGAVKDRLTLHGNALIKAIAKAVEQCIEEKDFSVDTDSRQIAYEVYSFVVGGQIYHKTLDQKNARKILSTSIDNLISRCSRKE